MSKWSEKAKRERKRGSERLNSDNYNEDQNHDTGPGGSGFPTSHLKGRSVECTCLTWLLR